MRFGSLFSYVFFHASVLYTCFSIYLTIYRTIHLYAHYGTMLCVRAPTLCVHFTESGGEAREDVAPEFLAHEMGFSSPEEDSV